jgi:DNA-binding IclR family transcriptional regulator
MSRGLGKVQRRILNIVCDFPEWGASIKYIHNLTKQHKASVSRGITSLETRDLVYRVENEERVKPTPAGIDYHLQQLEKTHAI